MARHGLLALAPLWLLAAGCFQDDYAFPNSDDVRMARTESDASRDAELAEYGDVYALGMQSAHEVNGWIGEGIDAAGRVIRLLEPLPPSSYDGDWDVYGPHNDPESGLAWRISIDGGPDGSRFRVDVGKGKSDMDEILSGEIDIDGDVRLGSFLMDFDVVEKHGVKAGPDRDRSYKGSMEVRFERDQATELKLVDIIYTDFEVTQEIPIREYFSADGYSFRRGADGDGAFSLDIMSTFQAQVWSGPERERMTIDLAWNEDGAGTGSGKVLELEGEGDLAFGDIVLDECFDGDGYFTWRHLDGEYGKAFPAYNSGDASACVEIKSGRPEFSAD